MNVKILLGVLLLAIALGLTSLFVPGFNFTNNVEPAHENLIISNDKPTGGDFTLNSAQGPVALHDFKGKLVLLYFGYTYCPDICPTNLSNLAVAYRQLSKAQQDQVQIVFVSVDPERDTPQRLQEYTSYFEADIIGLTGQSQTIAEIADRYGVVYAKVDNQENATHYAVDHSAFTYVIDQNGKLQNQLPHATTPDMFMQTVNQFIKE